MLMKAILLCAGQGSRLRPLTDDRPKGMVQVGGRPILERQIELLRAVGVDDIVVVGGYRHDAIVAEGVVKRINTEYESTNMVYSMFAAEQDFDAVDAVLVSYADILYSRTVLEAIIAAPHAANVVIDLDWYEYFAARNEDVLDDAETLALDEGRIVNIGAKPSSVEEIQGQYIGLMKFDAGAIAAISEIFHSGLASGAPIGWGRPIRNAYMTDLIQELINRGEAVHAVPIHGEWCEIDTPEDFTLAEAMLPKIYG